MAIKKQYLKTKPICKVTFRVPKQSAKASKAVHLVGEFNDWNPQATPMKGLKNGEFTATLDLEPGREYQFRYLFDQQVWENEWQADKYVQSNFGNCDNSVVIV